MISFKFYELLLLLDSMVLNILYFELECLKELLLLESIEFDLNDLALSWIKSTTSPGKKIGVALLSSINLGCLS